MASITNTMDTHYTEPKWWTSFLHIFSQFLSRTQPNTDSIAETWLAGFSDSILAQDADTVTKFFAPDGFLRDMLVFTWARRTIRGHDKISAYLKATLGDAGVSGVTMDKRPSMAPHSSLAGDGIAFGIVFRTAVGCGRGYVNLDSNGKAAVVLMVLEDIDGHPEAGPNFGGHQKGPENWSEVQRQYRGEIEKDPYVLIVGAGQAGLVVAARFRQMGLKTLIIDKEPRVGNVWRNRYPTLTLHTPRSHHQLLYQPFPTNWPLFTPGAKFADWLEQYAVTQELVVWTGSTVAKPPTYNRTSKTWTAQIDHDGTQVVVHPAHIICATGVIGTVPKIPQILNSDVFRGKTLPANRYSGGRAFTGKDVVVVGAGNTSSEICQDLVFHGAKSVTMVQRSTTCVMTLESQKHGHLGMFPEGAPVDASDLEFIATPIHRLKELLAMEAHVFEAEHELMHDGLRKAGLSVHLGDRGTGLLPLALERLGGYWVDTGCAELIISGKVKIKHGVEIKEYQTDSLTFSDGSTIPADVVIYATGYRNVRDTLEGVFGEEVIKQTGEVWGLDEEGEVKGVFRPSGHPGFRYIGGDLPTIRFMSKILALELKAIQLGMRSED